MRRRVSPQKLHRSRLLEKLEVRWVMDGEAAAAVQQFEIGELGFDLDPGLFQSFSTFSTTGLPGGFSLPGGFNLPLNLDPSLLLTLDPSLIGSFLENADPALIGSLIESLDAEQLQVLIEQVDPSQLLPLIENLDWEQLTTLASQLDPQQWMSLLEGLDPALLPDLLAELDVEQVAEWLNNLEPADVQAIVDDLDPALVAEFFEHLESPEVQEFLLGLDTSLVDDFLAQLDSETLEQLRAAIPTEWLSRFEEFFGVGGGDTSGGGSTDDYTPPTSFANVDELNEYLRWQAVARWEGSFGQPTWNYPHPIILGSGFDIAVARNMVVATSYTSTNTQVVGVDEGDIVETDGDYLYTINGDKLTIIDIRDPAHMHVVSETKVNGWGGSIYLSGDRLAYVSSQQMYATFRLSIWPGHYDPSVDVTVFDISDRTQPRVVQQATVDGSESGSRVVDGRLVLVTSERLNFPEPERICEETGIPLEPPDMAGIPREPDDMAGILNAEGELSDDAILVATSRISLPYPPIFASSCVYESRESYVARLSEQNLAERVMPRLQTGSGEETTSQPLVDVANLHVVGGDQFSVVSIFDLADDDSLPEATLGVFGAGAHNVYMSSENLYAIGSTWDEEGGNSTTIQKYSLTGESLLELTATGEVPGNLLNQFSVDEHNGFLRVATTQTLPQPIPDLSETDVWIWTPPTLVNSLYVLDSDLQQVGTLEDIAPGESIFAARFLGDQAYLVTFRRIDPLFAIDLSDPTAPAITDELELPGFSNYLHPVADGLLLGIGQSGDANGLIGGLKLSLFDVSDATDISESAQFVATNDWHYSPAQYDHHAVTYAADSGLLALPVYGRDGSGIWLFQVDTESPAIHHLGAVQQKDALRAVFVDDVLFSIGHSSIVATHVGHLDQPLGRLYFGPIGQPDYVSVSVDAGPTRLDVLANDGPYGERLKDAEIVSVDTTNAVGQVAITDDGQAVTYTSSDPASHLTDHFTYTVRETSGREHVIDVWVTVEFTHRKEEMVALARRHLADRLDISPEDVAVVVAWSNVFQDACLGVNHSDEVCAQVLTPGFVIQLEADDVMYIYHTDTEARVVPASEHPINPGDGGGNDGNSGGSDGNNGGGVIVDSPINDHFSVRIDSSDNRLDVLANDFPGVVFITAPTITSVIAPEDSGAISVADDGFSLIYTPKPGFTGRETFTYFVDGGKSAEVTVEVSDALVGVTLEATDLEGNPLSSVVVGAEYLLNVYVEDLRAEPQGVFSTYLDIDFESELSSATAINESVDFSVANTGDSESPGVINEVGGIANSVEPTGGGRRMLASVRMTATNPGEIHFRANPGESIGSEISIFGVNNKLSPGAVDFGSTELEVLGGWRNSDEPTDCNADGVVSVIDAQLMIGNINEGGARDLRYETPTQRTQVTFTNAETLAPQRMFLDVNNDGMFTANDILLVINQLFQRLQSLSNAAGEPIVEAAASSLASADVDDVFTGYVAPSPTIAARSSVTAPRAAATPVRAALQVVSEVESGLVSSSSSARLRAARATSNEFDAVFESLGTE